MKIRHIIIVILALGCISCGVTVSDYDAAIMDGLADLKLNKPQKAIEAFERAIKIDAKKAGGYLGRANSLNTLGRHQKSLEDYNRALAIDPTLANAYANRGIAHAHLGEIDKAIADYEKALALDPKIDDKPGFVKRLFDNEPNTDKGIRRHLEALKKQQRQS
jgi:tetratricopeptide (TPR) repeat protein